MNLTPEIPDSVVAVWMKQVVRLEKALAESEKRAEALVRAKDETIGELLEIIRPPSEHDTTDRTGRIIRRTPIRR